MSDLLEQRHQAHLEDLRQRREAVAERERQAAARRGRRIPVGPTRQHLETLLSSGMSVEEIAIRAGLDRTTIRRLLSPATKGVFRESASAVLAVTPILAS